MHATPTLLPAYVLLVFIHQHALQPCQYPTCFEHAQREYLTVLQAKTYCRDFLQYGRARIRLFDDDGKPANPSIPNSTLHHSMAWPCWCFIFLPLLSDPVSMPTACQPVSPSEAASGVGILSHDSAETAAADSKQLTLLLGVVQGRCCMRRWQSCAPGIQAGLREPSNYRQSSKQQQHPVLQPQPASRVARVGRKSGSRIQNRDQKATEDNHRQRDDFIHCRLHSDSRGELYGAALSVH